MSSAELKLKLDLINKITELKEVRIIRELKRFLDFELDEGVYELSKEQEEKIRQARKDISNGDIFDNEEVEKEFDEWLNEE